MSHLRSLFQSSKKKYIFFVQPNIIYEINGGKLFNTDCPGFLTPTKPPSSVVNPASFSVRCFPADSGTFQVTTISHGQQCQDQGWTPTDWKPKNQWMSSLAPASSNLLLSVLETITRETFLQNFNDAKTSFLIVFFLFKSKFS